MRHLGYWIWPVGGRGYRESRPAADIPDHTVGWYVQRPALFPPEAGPVFVSNHLMCALVVAGTMVFIRKGETCRLSLLANGWALVEDPDGEDLLGPAEIALWRRDRLAAGWVVRVPAMGS